MGGSCCKTASSGLDADDRSLYFLDREASALLQSRLPLRLGTDDAANRRHQRRSLKPATALRRASLGNTLLQTSPATALVRLSSDPSPTCSTVSGLGDDYDDDDADGYGIRPFSLGMCGANADAAADTPVIGRDDKGNNESDGATSARPSFSSRDSDIGSDACTLRENMPLGQDHLTAPSSGASDGHRFLFHIINETLLLAHLAFVLKRRCSYRADPVFVVPLSPQVVAKYFQLRRASATGTDVSNRKSGDGDGDVEQEDRCSDDEDGTGSGSDTVIETSEVAVEDQLSTTVTCLQMVGIEVASGFQSCFISGRGLLAPSEQLPMTSTQVWQLAVLEAQGDVPRSSNRRRDLTQSLTPAAAFRVSLRFEGTVDVDGRFHAGGDAGPVFLFQSTERRTLVAPNPIRPPSLVLAAPAWSGSTAAHCL